MTRMFGVIAGFATQACLAWFLAPSGRGEFAVCTTFALVIGVVFGLGFDRAIQYQLIAGRINRSDAVGLAILTALINTVLACAVGWFVVRLPMAFFGKTSLDSFRLALLVVPGIAMFTALSLLMDGLRMFRAAAVVVAVHAIGNVLMVVLLVGLLDWGVAGAIVASAAASGVSVFLQILYLETRPSLPVLRLQRPMLSYAVRYYLARLGNVVNVDIGLIVLAVVASTPEIGLFAAASVLTGKITLLPQALATVVLPRVGQALDGRPELVAQACRISSLFLAIGLLALAIASPWLVPLALSPAFSAAVPLVWLLAFGTWARGVALPISSYFIGINRPGLVSGLTVFELACSVVLIGPSYALFGLEGAALGATVASVLSNGARFIAFDRVSGRRSIRVWLPSFSDLRDVLSTLERSLGRNRPGRQISFSLEAAGGGDESFRQTIVLPDRIIKRQPPPQVELELAKTRSGATIGERCGLFRVPTILEAESGHEAAVFCRIPRAIQLWTFLHAYPTASVGVGVVSKAAAALAHIHAQFALESRYAVELSADWQFSCNLRPVWLHGDFTAFNLMLTDDGETLWITDWATSDVIDSRATVGTPLVDVAFFVGSLFFQSHFGARRIADRNQLAAAFVHEYCCAAPVDIRHACLYLRAYAERLQSMTPTRYEQVRKFRHELISEAAFVQFTKEFSPSLGSRG